MSTNVATLLGELEGWGGLDLDNPIYEKLRLMEEADALAHAHQVQTLYQSDLGVYWLHWAIRNYIMPRVVRGELLAAAGERQGEINVGAGILATMEYAKHGGRR